MSSGDGAGTWRLHVIEFRWGRQILNVLNAGRRPETCYPLPTSGHLAPVSWHPGHVRRSGSPATADPDVVVSVPIPGPVARNPDVVIASAAFLPEGFPRCRPAAGLGPPGLPESARSPVRQRPHAPARGSKPLAAPGPVSVVAAQWRCRVASRPPETALSLIVIAVFIFCSFLEERVAAILLGT